MGQADCRRVRMALGIRAVLVPWTRGNPWFPRSAWEPMCGRSASCPAQFSVYPRFGTQSVRTSFPRGAWATMYGPPEDEHRGDVAEGMVRRKDVPRKKREAQLFAAPLLYWNGRAFGRLRGRPFPLPPRDLPDPPWGRGRLHPATGRGRSFCNGRCKKADRATRLPSGLPSFFHRSGRTPLSSANQSFDLGDFVSVFLGFSAAGAAGASDAPGLAVVSAGLPASLSALAAVLYVSLR